MGSAAGASAAGSSEAGGCGSGAACAAAIPAQSRAAAPEPKAHAIFVLFMPQSPKAKKKRPAKPLSGLSGRRCPIHLDGCITVGRPFRARAKLRCPACRHQEGSGRGKRQLENRVIQIDPAKSVLYCTAAKQDVQGRCTYFTRSDARPARASP